MHERFKKYFSPGVVDKLFGSDSKAEALLWDSENYPRIAYNACIFYAAALQAFVFAKAICGGDSLSEREQKIKNQWLSATERMQLKGNGVFSFLMQCSEMEESVLDRNVLDVLGFVRTAWTKYCTDAKQSETLLYEEDLEELFEHLPLLRQMDFDKNGKILFSVNGNDYAISAFPFFVEIQDDFSSDSHWFGLASVDKGRTNGELCFNIIQIDNEYSLPKSKKTYAQVSENETIRTICNTLKIKTDWYPIEEYWCDLSFIKRLMEITAGVLKKFWGLNSAEKGRDIKNDLKRVLNLEQNGVLSSKIEGFLHSFVVGDKIGVDNLDRVILGLFINLGVFYTIHEILLDSTEDTYGAALFDLYMEAFAKSPKVDLCERDEYRKQCDEIISEHLTKLQTVVPNPNTKQYQIRACEIKAEWRTFAVLKIAGIRSDNIFIDKESIMSIDDYFDRLSNPNANIMEDIGQVVNLLCGIYGAIAENERPFNEEKFYRDLQSIRADAKDQSLGEKFERLEKVFQALESDANLLDSLIGRRTVCDLDTLKGFKEKMVALEQSNFQRTTFSTSQKVIFISYRHDDEKIVKPIVERWKKARWTVKIDCDFIKPGNDWKTDVDAILKDKACTAFVIFLSRNSIISDEVLWEVEHAQALIKDRLGNVSDEEYYRYVHDYFVPLNLEDESVEEYAKEYVHGKDSPSGHNDVAEKMCKQFNNRVIHFSKADIFKEDFDEKMRKRLFEEEMVMTQECKFNKEELDIANFYSFLKYGDDADWCDANVIRKYFFEQDPVSHPRKGCIFPILASMKETKIKRDNVSIMGYEIIDGKGRGYDKSNYIFMSKPIINPDDYYCIPHFRMAADDCSWMADPLLISCKRILGTDKGEE